MFPRNKILSKKAPLMSGEKPKEFKYLSSWKEIANYMGKGVRTVQRYEAHFALPVRRPAGKSRAAVVATRAEIDAWIESSPVREALERSVRDIFKKDPELKRIREGVREMHELRQQMNALRNETHVSLGVLLAGLQTLFKTTRENTADQSLEAALRSRRILTETLITKSEN